MKLQLQWVRDDFKTWRDQGRHPNIASFNTLSSSNTTNTTAPPATTVAPEIKTLEDAWMSWQRSRRDPEKYPILPNNRKYTDWIILIKRQFEADRCTRVIDDSFKDIDVKCGAVDIALYKAQLNHMSIVLERVLQTTDGKRFTRKHKDAPREIWKLHELHQRLSATNATITTALSQELAKMKVIDFDCFTQCLDAFDTKFEKFNEISPVDLPAPMAVSFLMSSTHGNSELRSAWATKETICQS